MELKTPKCPGCQKQVNYLEAFCVKNKPEYVCDLCKKTFDIVAQEPLRKIGFGVLLFEFFLSVICVLFLRSASVWPFFISLIVFSVFFVMSPFFIRFK